MKSYINIIGLLVLFSCASQQKANPKKLAKIYSKKGTGDLINKDYTEALGNLMKAYKYNPEDDEINNNLGMAYYFKKNTNKAVIHLKKALDINPKNIDAKMNIATIYMNMGQHAKAEKVYLDSVQTDLTYRGHFRTYYNLSIIEETKNNSVMAREYLKKSVSENELYCPAHFKLGQMDLAANNYEGALEHFKSASGGSCQKEAVAHYYQAVSHLKLGQFESARFKFAEIVSRFPDTEYSKKSKTKLSSFQSIINKTQRTSF